VKGQEKMQMKAALTFAYLNMKKLAIIMDKMGKRHPNYDTLCKKIADYLLNIVRITKYFKIIQTPDSKSGVCLCAGYPPRG